MISLGGRRTAWLVAPLLALSLLGPSLLGLSLLGPSATATGKQAPSDGVPMAAASKMGAASKTSRSGTTHADATLPGGGRKVFGRKRFLVAYYGAAGASSLGVLGETDVDTAHRRLVRAAKPFKKKGETVVPVYELIVTVADRVPGNDGDYNHDASTADVQAYVDAAARNQALLVLDIQPGRSDFLTVAQRWEWALRHPHVGLALDAEWRVGPTQVPGQVIGSVRANEVNRVSRWLSGLTAAAALPEKVFLLHQFKVGTLPDIRKIRRCPGLASVQHFDGYGTPAQKLAQYHLVAEPKRFTMGFKLFYDEDKPRMTAKAVRAIDPPVRFVSFQ